MATVVMLGQLAELAGWRERRLEAVTLEALKALLSSEDPALGERLNGPGVITVVNRQMVRGDAELGPDDEVGLLPPVSGG